MAVRRPSMAIASARDDLYIDYSLSYDHQGTRAFITHHREVAGPVGSPVDLGMASATSFAMPWYYFTTSVVFNTTRMCVR